MHLTAVSNTNTGGICEVQVAEKIEVARALVNIHSVNVS